jgi:hypothetical protein
MSGYDDNTSFFVIKRYDHRKYPSPNSKTKRVSKSLQNTYYHLNSDCCRRQCPMFEMNRDVIVHISEEQRHILENLNITPLVF